MADQPATSETSAMVLVPLAVVERIVNEWRSANEAPGGCSPREAIDGMADAVWQMELARREQLERPCGECGRVGVVVRPCPFCSTKPERTEAM